MALAVAPWSVGIFAPPRPPLSVVFEVFDRDRGLQRNCRCLGITLTSGTFHDDQIFMRYINMIRENARSDCKCGLVMPMLANVSSQENM